MSRTLVNELNRELFGQDFAAAGEPLSADAAETYRVVARNYAAMESAVAVLSDMRTNSSRVCYGRFSEMIGLGEMVGREVAVDSIWEEEILRRIHPEDLREKYLQELNFFHLMKRRTARGRAGLFLAGRLRMKDPFGGWIPVLHRLFYVSDPCDEAVWLALCLYSPPLSDLPAGYAVVDSSTGRAEPLDGKRPAGILSERERQVLELIGRGLSSKRIAAMLGISTHTVSRHRQGILAKLCAGNSIEACRVARELGIL